MKRRPNLTEAEKDLIATLREEGWTCKRIAERIGCSVGSVDWYLLEVGIGHPNRQFPSSQLDQPYTRAGRVVRPFTAEEDAQLIQLSLQGIPQPQIAKRLNRRHNSIIGRLRTLARREERMEGAA